MAPAYLMESCDPKVKATAAFSIQVMQGIATLLATVVGFEELLGTPELWPYLLGLPICFGTLQILLVSFCPESPRYLLMTRESDKEAKQGMG